MTLDRAATGGLWSPRRRAMTFGLVLTTTLVASEALAVATIMPLVSDDLGGLALYGWVFAGFFLGNLLGIAVAGRQLDRYGLVRPFALGLGLFALGLVIGGLAPSMPILIAGRILQGIGAGYEPPTAYVAIGRAYPDALRPRILFWLSVAWVLPGLIGPALSAEVAKGFGWRAVFLGLLPFVAVTGGLTLRALAAADRPNGPAPTVAAGGRLVPAVRLAVGAGLLVAATTLSVPALGIPLAAGGLALGVPAFRRLTPDGTMRARHGLPAAVLLRGVLTFAFFAADAYVPLLLVEVRGADVSLGGVALTVATLTWTAGAWVQAHTIGRLGARPLVAAGFGVVAIGISGLVPALLPAVPVGIAVVALGIAGLGMGFAYSPLSIVVLREAEPGAEGASTSALSLSDVLGTALGTGVAGAILGSAVALGAGTAAGLGGAFSLSAVVAVVGFLASRRLTRGAGRRS
jgi:MFS family permease